MGTIYSQVSTAFTWRNVVIYGLIMGIVFILYNQLIKPFLSPLRKIPGRPYKPLIGNMMEVMKEQTMDNTIRWMKKLRSPILRTYFFLGEGRVVVASKEAFKYITVTNSKNYIRLHPLKQLKEVFGLPLFFISGQEHHAMRRLCNPAFNISLLNRMVPEFDRVTKSLSKVLKGQISDSGDSKGTVISIQPWFCKMTLDAFLKCGCDYDLGALEGKNEESVSSIFRLLNNIIFSLRIFDPFYLKWPTKVNKERWADTDRVKNIITEIIKSKRENLDKLKAMESTDILTQILLAQDENGKGLSDYQLFEQISGFMFAGHETTSTTLCWILIALCEHPEIQKLARDEANRLLPTPESCVTPEVLDKMTYITSVIKEAMRLYPAVPMTLRKTVHDDTLCGYHIPAGTPIMIHIGALMRNPDYWPEPQKFRPERFAEDAPPIDPYTYQPFIGGPYMCIGYKFAMMELKCVLALLLKEFRFSLPEDYKYVRRQRITMIPHPTLRVRMEKLN